MVSRSKPHITAWTLIGLFVLFTLVCIVLTKGLLAIIIVVGAALGWAFAEVTNG